MSSTIDYTRVNAIGATVLSILTILCASYLLIALMRQGRGKLRVRLLTGLVLSDIVLGILVLPPEILYVAGQPMVTGTLGCNAVGFLLTMALFTQHLWTLAIAIATFLLLKHPLSRTTIIMERYSWAIAPAILFFSALHSFIWWRTYGWMSIGNLCYYDGENPDALLDPRDLVQFIPRAVTFVTIAILYSMLYKFLRRPDTIQISSNYETSRSVVTGNGLQRIMQGKEAEDDRPPWERMELGRWDDEPIPLHSTMPTLAQQRDSFRRRSTEASGSNPPSLARVDTISSLASGTGTWEGQRSDIEMLVTPMQLDEGQRQTLSPVVSERKARLETPTVPEIESFEDEKKDETMAEFFQNHAISGTGVEGNSSVPHQLSAAAYFNRQASLLMLYFPLAYVVIFSASLVRILYAMTTHGAPNPILSIISAWFTLSVGFIDALVYGFAEFYVKRKVRKAMPDR